MTWPKQVVKIADLAQLGRTVDISEDQQIMVRALNLREMVALFIDSRDVFLPLYAAGIEGKVTADELGSVSVVGSRGGGQDYRHGLG